MYFYRPLRPLRALTFDLDNTLYDNIPVITRTKQKSLQFLQQYHPLLGNLEQADYKRFRRKIYQQNPKISHNISYWHWRSIELAMRHVGLSKPAARLGTNAVMEVVLYWRNQITVPKETHQILSALYQRWPLVAITNGNASPKDCGLAGYFCYILRAGSNGRVKPWADMYQLATKYLNVPPETILHVGDDLKTDITGAIRYGMQACWLNQQGKNSKLLTSHHRKLLPHLEITQLSSLIALL